MVLRAYVAIVDQTVGLYRPGLVVKTVVGPQLTAIVSTTEQQVK